MRERHADGQSRRWRAAADTLTSQHGACGPESTPHPHPPLRNGFLHYRPPLPPPFPLLLYSICSSCRLSPHLLHFLPIELRSPLPSSAAPRSRFIPQQTDGSWLLRRRKLGHVFLIESCTQKPCSRPLVQSCLERALGHLCDTAMVTLRGLDGSHPGTHLNPVPPSTVSPLKDVWSFASQAAILQYVFGITGDLERITVSVSANAAGSRPGLCQSSLKNRIRFRKKTFVRLPLISAALHLQEEVRSRRFH